MGKTLQEILAENNVKANNSTQVKPSEDNQTKEESKSTTPTVSETNNTNTNTDINVKKMNFQTLMSSDNTDNLDIKKFQGTVSSRPHIEEDIYNARCVKIDRIMGQNFDGVPEEKFCWHFELISASDGSSLTTPVTLKYYTRLAFGEKSNNYKVYGAFFGKVPEKYNILECISKECRVNVVDTQSKDGGNTYSKIKDILKVKNK